MPCKGKEGVSAFFVMLIETVQYSTVCDRYKEVKESERRLDEEEEGRPRCPIFRVGRSKAPQVLEEIRTRKVGFRFVIVSSLSVTYSNDTFLHDNLSGLFFFF